MIALVEQCSAFGNTNRKVIDASQEIPIIE